MNTLDLYIDHLQRELKELEAEVALVEAGKADGFGIYHSLTDATVELNGAIEFANEHGLTVRHLTPENRKKRDERAVDIAKGLWLEQNADDYDWAISVWPEMTSPDDWSHEALELLEEAFTIMDKEKTDD